uniref:Natural killer cells antigen CD94 n=1 Tax=Ornithorhynchus anatinus TaxID=9258 RepID=F7E312_ORNAN
MLLIASIWRLQAKNTSASKWKLTAVTLGLFCLALLATAGILTIQVIQRLSQPIIQWHFNDSSIISPNTTTNQTGCHCGPCPEKWLLHRKSCYFFSEEKGTWSQSEAACQTQNSSLLKIENQKMVDFLFRFSLYGWIGLSRHKASGRWKWTDDSDLLLNLSKVVLKGEGKDCAKYTSTYPVFAENCTSTLKYICRHRIP